MKRIKIFLIAGEPSGDRLGAALMKSLQETYKGKVIFCGIGGHMMTKEGLSSIFAMQQISLMGFFEIIPHIFRILKLIKFTKEEIVKFQPDVVITIDSPGFCFRVVKQIDRGLTKIVHYVAPSVWAYKPERAAYMKKYYDLVLALLPFEPPYFTKLGLPCEFVGHPIIEGHWLKIDSSTFKKKYNIPIGSLVFGIMCGSRKGEINCMLPVFIDTINKLKCSTYLQNHDVIWVFPTVSLELAEQIRLAISILDIKHLILVNEPEKISMLKAMNCAIVKSGTSSLELALAKVPMIVVYKTSIITAWILRNFYKFNSYASIINVMAKKQIIPEFIQENCTSEKILQGFIDTVSISGQEQVRQCDVILRKLSPRGASPSVRAAQAILKLL